MSDNPLSPDYSPAKLGKSKATGVRRVNNLPVYILLGGFTVFLLVMGMVAYNRAHRQENTTEADSSKNNNGSAAFAKQIVGDHGDGIVPPYQKPNPPTIPKEPAIEVPIARSGQGQPTDMNRPPVPPSRAGGNDPRDNDLQRIHAKKIEQLEAALSAKTNVQVTDMRSPSAMGLPAEPNAADSTAPATRDAQLQRMEEIRKRIEAIRTEDPNAAYKARLAQIQGVGGGVASDNAAAPRLVPVGGSGSSAAPWLQPLLGGEQPKPNNDIGQFSGTGQPDRWKLNSTVEPPRTAYELRAGFVIPATMISGINSELPGQIMAQVSQSVYDTPTGKFLLIPQGSRLVGSYSSSIAYGQKRVLVAWQRIIFPDGKAMDIGAMPGADGGGYAGFNDLVDNHYVRIFGSALLMSAVVAGISYSQQSLNNNNNTGNTIGQQQTASGALSQAVGQQFGTVIAQMVSKNMNIAPTLEIRPGFRFNVMVIRDLAFNKPYRSFDY